MAIFDVLSGKLLGINPGGVNAAPVGDVKTYQSDANYIKCDGSFYPSTTYPSLYSAIGKTFGGYTSGATEYFRVPTIRTQGAPTQLTAPNSVADVSPRLALLQDGRILWHGGSTGIYFGTISGNSISWASATDAGTAFNFHTLTTLSDGRVLRLGGNDGSDRATASLFTITGNSIATAAGTAYPSTVTKHSTNLLPDNRIFVSGGYTGSWSTTCYFGTIAGDVITWAASTVYPLAIQAASQCITDTGKIVVIGGYVNPITKLASGAAGHAVYVGTVSSNTITWVEHTQLPYATQTHRSFFANGYIYVVGGLSATTSTRYINTVLRGKILSEGVITWEYLDALDNGFVGDAIYLPTQNKMLLAGSSLGCALYDLNINYQYIKSA